jgi:hypothetical protein
MKPEQTTTDEASQEPQDRTPQRRPYEAPRLVPFGHVTKLTAGVKFGTSDLTSQNAFSSII